MATLPMHYKRRAVEIVRQLKAAEYADRRNRHTGEMYCVHGVNLGTWDGPDYMCGACEDGTSHYVYALYVAHAEWRRDQQSFRRALHEAVRDFHVEWSVKNGPAFAPGDLWPIYAGIFELRSV